jgi:hypothetical protein
VIHGKHIQILARMVKEDLLRVDPVTAVTPENGLYRIVPTDHI